MIASNSPEKASSLLRRFMVKELMKFIRWILRFVILFLEKVFSPTPIERSAEEQKKVDAAVAGLALYQYEACPFCVKVRRSLKSSGVKIPLRDATKEPFRRELLESGGKAQAPCLQIRKPDGTVQWLYESNDIIAYVQKLIVAAV